MLEWSEFAQRLARELAGLPRDTILIVRERDEIRHYVQAMWEPDRLYAEAVSNNFLEGPLVLTASDEEVLAETGWRSPAQQVSSNWWTELQNATTTADFDRLADMMVTALRDVQGVRRPADLVYESFRRLGTGLIELVDFGIDVADAARVTERLSSQVEETLVDSVPVAAPVERQQTPGGRPDAPFSPPQAPPGGYVAPPGANGSGPLGTPVAGPPPAASVPGQAVAPEPAEMIDPAPTEPMPAAIPAPMPAPVGESLPGEPVTPLEERLTEARRQGDHVTYFELLLQAELIIPATAQAVENPGVIEFATATVDDTTAVLVFTSARAMAQALGARAGLHRRLTFAELAAAWPDQSWSMSVNAGLPSGIVLDSATVSRLETMRRTAEQAAAVDAVVTPSTPGVAIRVPHGARLWRTSDRSGAPAVPLAVYDAMNARWTGAPATDLPG